MLQRTREKAPLALTKVRADRKRLRPIGVDDKQGGPSAFIASSWFTRE